MLQLFLFLIYSLVAFLIVCFFGYGVHWLLHQKWMGRAFEAHMTHHLKLYPPNDYYSLDKYRSAGEDNTFYTFAFASLPLLLVPIILCYFGVFSIIFTIYILSEMLIIGFLHDYLHDAFHIYNHCLNKFRFMQKLNELHFQHHLNMKKNFGIFNFWFDKLFKTYVNCHQHKTDSF